MKQFRLLVILFAASYAAADTFTLHTGLPNHPERFLYHQESSSTMEAEIHGKQHTFELFARQTLEIGTVLTPEEQSYPDMKNSAIRKQSMLQISCDRKTKDKGLISRKIKDIWINTSGRCLESKQIAFKSKKSTKEGLVTTETSRINCTADNYFYRFFPFWRLMPEYQALR